MSVMSCSNLVDGSVVPRRYKFKRGWLAATTPILVAVTFFGGPITQASSTREQCLQAVSKLRRLDNPRTDYSQFASPYLLIQSFENCNANDWVLAASSLRTSYNSVAEAFNRERRVWVVLGNEDVRLLLESMCDFRLRARAQWLESPEWDSFAPSTPLPSPETWQACSSRPDFKTWSFSLKNPVANIGTAFTDIWKNGNPNSELILGSIKSFIVYICGNSGVTAVLTVDGKKTGLTKQLTSNKCIEWAIEPLGLFTGKVQDYKNQIKTLKQFQGALNRVSRRRVVMQVQFWDGRTQLIPSRQFLFQVSKDRRDDYWHDYPVIELEEVCSGDMRVSKNMNRNVYYTCE